MIGAHEIKSLLDSLDHPDRDVDRAIFEYVVPAQVRLGLAQSGSYPPFTKSRASIVVKDPIAGITIHEAFGRTQRSPCSAQSSTY